VNRPRRAGAALVAVLALAACTQQAPDPPPIPVEPQPTATASASPTPKPARDFTVATTDAITQLDPAAMTTGGSQAVAFSVFQRLMATPAGQTQLKPDAARDCIFEARDVYTCTLLEGLHFHSGRDVTSADVKFSVERARRLRVAGSGVELLDAIKRIETPDALTVRFVLSYPDSDIGYALATSVASIVDSRAYPPDEIAGTGRAPQGSGPYRWMGGVDGVWNLARYESYQGYAPASIVRVTLREYPTSAALEQAVTDGDVDVAWRGLSTAATERLRARAAAGGPYTPVDAVGARVVRLVWNRSSGLADDGALRRYLATAVADRRTMTGQVPLGVTGASTGLFPAGGLPSPTPLPAGDPVSLTLGYDPRMPNGADMADGLKRTLEATGRIRVTVRPNAAGADTGAADLLLVDTRAPVWTVRAWLLDALADPSATYASTMRLLVTNGLASADDATSSAARTTIQSYAADDARIAPLRQADEYVFVREGYGVDLTHLGPGWQLDLAAFSETP